MKNKSREFSPAHIHRINNSVLSKIIDRVVVEEGYEDNQMIMKKIETGTHRIRLHYQEWGMDGDQVDKAYEGLVRMANEYSKKRKDTDLRASDSYKIPSRRLGLIGD